MTDLLIQLETESVAERQRKFTEKSDSRYSHPHNTRGSAKKKRDEEKGEAERLYDAHFQMATPARKACLDQMKKSTLQESGKVISLLAGLAVMKQALTENKFM
jgi:hypothetical protein